VLLPTDPSATVFATVSVEFAQVGREVAVVRFHRREITLILLKVSEADGSTELATMRTMQRALAEISNANCRSAVFDWLTGMSPPLAAMVHGQDKLHNGLDMLAMCVAGRFFAMAC